MHDKERAHNGVIADRRCGSESYKADVTDPVYLERYGDGQQPQLAAQALPVALRRHGSCEPAVVPELVRLPVPRAPGGGQVAQNRKGDPPFTYTGCDFPHVDGRMGPARF